MKPHSDKQMPTLGGYGSLVAGIGELLEQVRRQAARAVNSLLTATYWEIGRRIVEFEQGGAVRAEYGEELLVKLSADLTSRYGRGFSRPGLQRMRTFYLDWEICSTPSSELEARAKCEELRSQPECLPAPKDIEPADIALRLSTQALMGAFRLSWSHYVRLMSVDKPVARVFYENEAIRGGWSVRQLDRQISTQFYERTAKSQHQDAMLARGREAKPGDVVSLREEIRDPYLLEFLNLRDEYSESDLEEAIIHHLEWFLLEMGAGFTFVARQKRIRIGDEWYRLDLLLFHRRLRCLVVIDLKLGKFTHADAGQMNLYLNYAREHLMEPGENEPVGLILCSAKNDAVVHYAMGGIKANVFASRYMTDLPDEETLRNEILITQRAVRARLQEDRHNG